MKFSDVKDLSKSELFKKLSDTKKALMDAKLKNSMGRLENPALIRVFRRDIAKLLTVIHHKG